MEYIRHIPKTDLARKTRQIIQAVQRGQTIVIEHHGQPEAAIMDIMDYYLLRGVLHYYSHSPQIEANTDLSENTVAALESLPERFNLIIAHYLAGSISLSRAADLLNLTWVELRTRFLRLDIPVRTAPGRPDEIAADLENAAIFATQPQ